MTHHSVWSKLPDDMIRDIMMRIPPDQPQALVTIFAPWRRVLCEATFCREYRQRHGAAPLLGIFRTTIVNRKTEDDLYWFERSTGFLLPKGAETDGWYALSAHHGRVLFSRVVPWVNDGEDDADGVQGQPIEFLVWDLVTGQWWTLRCPRYNPCNVSIWNATILCDRSTDSACDHLGCHGGPFLVAFVGYNDEKYNAFASVYSSQTGRWTAANSVDYEARDFAVHDTWEGGNTVVLCDEVYFSCDHVLSVGRWILELDFRAGLLSAIQVDLPPFEDQKAEELVNEEEEEVIFITSDGGVLAFAGLKGTSLQLWSREEEDSDGNGAARWVPGRNFTLETAADHPVVVGFADDSVIFVSTEIGSFTVDLSSAQIREVPGISYKREVGPDILRDKVVPYITFYTLDHALGFMRWR